MDHPAATFDPVAHPWRTRALVASAVAALELVVLVAAGIALLGEPLSRQVRQAAEARALAPVTPARPAEPTPGAPRLARGETSILVLNGNGLTGSAARAAELARARGYIVGGVGNVVGGVGNAQRSDYTRSVVMYRPGYKAEGARLARDLRIRIVGPLDGLRAADLMGAHLALVVGDY